MIPFRLRRPMRSSRETARWLVPASCQARTACSSVGTSAGTVGASPKNWRTGALCPDRPGFSDSPALGPDEHHEQLEGDDQRQGGPRADQGTDRTVADAVRQVGTDGGDDPGTEAPACQWWHRLAPPAGLEDEHARRRDQAIRGERDEPGCQAGLAVRTDQFEPCRVRWLGDRVV